VTQPQRGSARSEVDDLRNIVDRLDLLMGGRTAAGGGEARGGVHQVVTEFADRIDELEAQVDELRTLVNHLMTIATWQAKVTAQLVDDELGGAEEDDPDAHAARPAAERREPASSAERAPDERPRGHPTDDRPPPRSEHRREEPRRQGSGRPPRTSTLDEDIDDILGVDRGHRTARDNGPPDFGI
jgi:hypothetical protein